MVKRIKILMVLILLASFVSVSAGDTLSVADSLRIELIKHEIEGKKVEKVKAVVWVVAIASAVGLLFGVFMASIVDEV